MRNSLYIIYFTMIYFVNCSSECTHYYLVLKEYFDDFDGELKPMIEPTSMKLISNEYPTFNKTKEFKVLQDNKGCILDLTSPSCALAPITKCLEIKKSEYKMGTDIHYTTLTSDVTVRDDVTESTTHTEAISRDSSSEEPTSTVSTDTVSSSEEPLDTVTDPYDVTTIATTPDDIESTTEYNNTIIGNADGLSAIDKKDVAKIVAVSALGATGTAALGYFVATKIKHMLQYGAYYLAESNPSVP